MAKAEGFTKPGFEKVLDVFRSNLEKGVEKGGSFAAYYKGELVVNIWGGTRNEESEKPWQRDTLSSFFSSTKALSAICIAHLVDKGILDYSEMVSTYWPEFAQNGKGNVTLRQYLTHTVGLMNIDGEWKSRDILEDYEALEKRMAAQKPYWEPGTKCGYHAMTFALYLDALIRKVDPKKRTLSQYFNEEIAEPFGIEFFIGLPEKYEDRATRLEQLEEKKMNVEELYQQFMDMLPTDEYFKKSIAHGSPTDMKEITDLNLPGNHATPCGSAYGFGTAESVAKVYGILSNGGTYNGKTMLSTKAIQDLEARIHTDIDQFIGKEITRGHGTMIHRAVDNNDYKNPQYTFGHAGAGGQFGFGDTHFKVGWAYTTNYMYTDLSTMEVMDVRAASVLHALYECIKKQENLPGPWKLYISGKAFESDCQASETGKK